jgi:hypothetical protein
MNDLPVPASPDRPKPPVEVHSHEPAPSWRELRERFSDLVKDIGGELKDVWDEEATPRLLAGLKRSREELDKLITKLEQRMAKEPARPAQP